MKNANPRDRVYGERSVCEISVPPEGWEETSLDQILTSLESGSRPKGGVRGIKEGVPSIGGEHLNENGGFRFEAIKFVPHEFYERMQRGRIEIGDILVVKDGATTGKVALVRSDFPHEPAVVNEHVFICRPVTKVHPPFLFYFLFSKEGQDRILTNFRGSAQGGINRSFASDTIVPLAPLPEQKRIVAKVEELLARLSVVRDRLAKVKEILKRFRQSVLSAACSGRLTEDWREGEDIDNDWLALRLADVGIVTGGITKNSKREILELRVPYLRVANVYENELRLDDVRLVGITQAEFERTLLKSGDLLFVEGNGSIEQIGRVSLWDGSIQPCVHQNHLIKFRSSRRVLPTYALFWMMSPLGRLSLSEAAVSTAGLYNLSISKIENLPIRVPCLKEQEKIVRRVKALFKLADAVEERVKEGDERAEKLIQAILAKAFRGELVLTEAELARSERRPYEPASALLHKIKTQSRIDRLQSKREKSKTRAIGHSK